MYLQFKHVYSEGYINAMLKNIYILYAVCKKWKI